MPEKRITIIEQLFQENTTFYLLSEVERWRNQTKTNDKEPTQVYCQMARDALRGASLKDLGAKYSHRPDYVSACLKRVLWWVRHYKRLHDMGTN